MFEQVNLANVWDICSQPHKKVSFYPEEKSPLQKSKDPLDIYHDGELSFPNALFFHVFYDKSYLVEDTQGIRFFHSDGNLNKELTLKFKELYADFILIDACFHCTLILLKDNVTYATKSCNLTQLTELSDSDNIKQIFDNEDGIIGIQYKDTACVIAADYQKQQTFNGRVKFPYSDLICIENGNEIDCYDTDFQPIKKISPDEVLQSLQKNKYPMEVFLLNRCKKLGVDVIKIWEHNIHVHYQNMDIVLDLTKSKKEHVAEIKNFLALHDELTEDKFRYVLAITDLIDFHVSRKAMISAAL